MSMPRVAKKAGVSVRIVYHYFPTKDALFEGLAEALPSLVTITSEAAAARPTSPKQLADNLPAIYEYLEANAELFRAVRLSEFGLQLEARRRSERFERTDKALTPLHDALDERDRRFLRAVVGSLASFDGFETLTRNWGLSTHEAAEVAAWATKVLCDRARRSGVQYRLGRRDTSSPAGASGQELHPRPAKLVRRGEGTAMRHRRIVALVALGLIGLVPVARADEAAVAGTPDTTIGPLISGTSSYVDGTYAWTDYAYDDRGTASPGSPNNAADLIQLQVSLHGRTLHLRAILETLVGDSRPVVMVGLDLDDDPATGQAGLPGWAASSPLGLDEVVVLDDADAATNSLEASVDVKVGADVRAVATVGLVDDPAVYDLAFVHAEDVCAMPSPDAATACVANPDNQPGQHLHQAAVLAGGAPASDAVATIDVKKLRTHATDLARVEGRGFHSLLYHSDLALGEGYRVSSNAARSTVLPHRIFSGAWQPYVVRLPANGAGPWPTIVYLHGRSGNHLQAFVNNFKEFDAAAMVVGVLGRGYDVGYGGIDWLGFVEPDGAYGEQDVLDVMADLDARRLRDDERTVVGGISMGGVGAFHIAELHPDVFTGVLPIVGGDGGILPGNWTPGLIENLHNMRLRMANGAIDPLAHLGSQLTPVTLQELRTVDYRAWEAARRHHEWQEGLVDCLWTELLSQPRVVDPARIIYTVNPAFEVHVAETGLESRHTGAYWLSGVEPRPDSLDRSVTSPPTSRIDVTSQQRSDRAPTATPIADAGQNVTSGADYCGPAPRQSQDAWEMNGVVLSRGPDQPTSNGMTVTMVGITAATVDLGRMSISISEPVTVSITGDGAAAFTMIGPWPDGEVALSRDDADAGTVPVIDGAVTIEGDFLGPHDYTVQTSA